MTNDDNQEGKFISLNVNDIPAYIAGYKDQLERERMRLAACGVAAMSNTRETAKKNRQVSDEYRSASFDDVCAAVDREMALRERVAELEAQNHTLKRQRDEAQREVCDMVARTRRKMGVRGQIVGMDRVAGEEVAAERGWDCFGEKKGGGA